MLKKLKHQIIRQKNSKLEGTPGEDVRDAMIKAGIEAAKESGYAAGNTTVNIALC
jgi:hypothetical protein